MLVFEVKDNVIIEMPCSVMIVANISPNATETCCRLIRLDKNVVVNFILNVFLVIMRHLRLNSGTACIGLSNMGG